MSETHDALERRQRERLEHLEVLLGQAQEINREAHELNQRSIEHLNEALARLHEMRENKGRRG